MPQDVVDLIMQDHREMERLFAKLQTEPETRPMLTPVLAMVLAAHSRAEEAEVYPAARKEAGETAEVEHSQDEHLLADQLLAKLVGCDPETASYRTALDELVEAVTHHVQEEEATVLPGLRSRLSEERRDELAGAFAAARAEQLGRRPDQLTKDALIQQAVNAGVPVSGRDKAGLEDVLRRRASE